MDRAVAEPTLDKLMDRDPHTMSDADLDAVVRVLRADRARFTVRRDDKKQAKKDKADDE